MSRVGKKYISILEDKSKVFEVVYDNGTQLVFEWQLNNVTMACLLTNHELKTYYKEYHEPEESFWYLYLDKTAMPFVSQVHDLNKEDGITLIGFFEYSYVPKTYQVIDWKVVKVQKKSGASS